MWSSGWTVKARAALRLFAGAVRGRARDDDELDEEMRFHLDKAAERNLRAGMSPSDARRAALLAFGGRTQWVESARDEQRSRLLDDFVRDVRYGATTLRRNRVFAASAIATIALGIGATVTVYSLIDSFYLRALPVPAGARLVRVAATFRSRSELTIGYPAFRAIRESARSFDAVAAHYSTAPLYIQARGESREEMGAVVSADYFPMLGIRPALGRFFLAGEDSVPDRDAVAVIGHAAWLR
ncbi:MAG: permease prefix domain 1-containing protein, partial [bacterium]